MNNHIKSILLILLCSLCSLSLSAQSKSKADTAYAAEQYETALNIYKQLAEQGPSVEVYYNLGNCYYRLDDIAHAILWYERAQLLSPGDDDVRFNLRLARTKTADKIIPEEELFFVRWYYSLLNTMSASGWARTGIVLFVLVLLAFGMYFFGMNLALRKAGFYGGVALLVLVLATNLMAWHQSARQNNHDRGIFVESSAPVKSTPSDNGTDLFVIHAGTAMQIVDSMKDWYQVRLSDGKEGWLPASVIELI